MTSDRKEDGCELQRDVAANHRTLPHEQWMAEARERFGDDPLSWCFVCPSCGHVASIADYKEAGAPEEAVAFSYVGRWTGAKAELGADGGPCNYAGGGLIGLNPVTVKYPDGSTMDVFDFVKTKEIG